MPQNTSVFVYGFAVFSMFFGSGNLVFPIEIGLNSGSGWMYGFLGLFITGITLPFLGLFAIKLHRGNYANFFGEIGPFARFALPLFILSLMGSFGVIPRCITVAHGGLSYLTPSLSLPIFSLIFCVITYYFCLKEQVMIRVLGKWMSPILLVTLAVLIITGIVMADGQTDVSDHTANFKNGFVTGYQTMDLFAAFFFSALIFKQIQNSMSKNATPREVIRKAIQPSLIGAGLLAIVYLGFVYLGAHYAPIFQDVPAESRLSAIAFHTMGSSASYFIALAVILSCLTTALALNNIYARYLQNLFKLGEPMYPWVLIFTTGVSFLISLVDFHGIVAFLGPILEATYPGIIALTLLSIMTKKADRLKKIAFYGITAWMVIVLLMK